MHSSVFTRCYMPAVPGGHQCGGAAVVCAQGCGRPNVKAVIAICFAVSCSSVVLFQDAGWPGSHQRSGAAVLLAQGGGRSGRQSATKSDIIVCVFIFCEYDFVYTMQAGLAVVGVAALLYFGRKAAGDLANSVRDGAISLVKLGAFWGVVLLAAKYVIEH